MEAVKQFGLIKPDTTTSLYFTGCARLELQYYSQTQEAIVDFTNCIELSSKTEQTPFGLEVWYKRALAYHNINKHDEAIRDYTEFINQCELLGERGESELHRGLIGRGRTYQAMYELDAAMQDMNEANRLTNNSNPYYLCCRASVHASKYEREKAVENIETASHRGCDKNVEALFQRALVLAELGRHNAALEDFRKALTLSTKPVQQSDSCFRCGLSEYALFNKSQAFQWFERAITLHPYHAQAYYHLGMMQTEKEHYKEALKTLNRAHELAPQQGDILLERAIVNQNLNKLDDSAHDRKRGKLLNASSFAIITILGNRIKTLREEIDRTGASSRNHLELAKAYDGLLSQKKNFQVKMEFYKIAIIEYRAAIETDTKYVYPQARALLALCQKKMNNLIEAHESHLEFYNLLAKHKGAVYYWKTYLLHVKDNMEADKLEPHLDETTVSKLIHMEFNRRKKDVDEETFQNDHQDIYKNKLTFYEQMRIDLSNVLAAISVLNLDRTSIINNTEDSMNK
jgi:tetratricopeptide (TPR) repeat protein